jgi:hypothetical protein
LLAQLHNTEIADAENAATAGLDNDIAQDDGDEEWEEEDDLTKNEKDEMAWLSGKCDYDLRPNPSLTLAHASDMLGGGGGRWDDLENDLDGQDNDEDLMSDQLMQVDMGVRMTITRRELLLN